MKGGGGGKSYTKYTKPLVEQGAMFDSGTGSDDGNDCGNIIFSTQLQKVQPSISTIVAGDILPIQSSATTLSVHIDSGEICGYIISPYNKKIIDCIKKGNRFKATVLSIAGKISTVQIEIDK